MGRTTEDDDVGCENPLNDNHPLKNPEEIKPTGRRYASVEELMKGQGVSQDVQDKFIRWLKQETDVEIGLKLDKIIKIDEIEPNSLVVLRIDPQYAQQSAYSLEIIVKKYLKTIREKNISIFVISPEASLDTMNEEQMKTYGWKRVSTLVGLDGKEL